MVWWNYFCYSSIGIRQCPTNPNERLIRFRPAEGEIVERSLLRKTSEVVFVIECSTSGYQFGYQEVTNGVQNVQYIGRVDNHVMTRDPPVGAPFTGMMLGLYAFGEMERCLAPADFQFAEFY